MRTLQQQASLIANIIRAVSERTGVSIADILGRSRIPHIARARQIAMKLVREHRFTMNDIRIAFRRQNHTTAHYACKTIAALEKEDKVLAEILSDLRRELSATLSATPV